MDLTFTPEGEEEEEVSYMQEVHLGDGTCWVADPDLLAHDSGAEGVLALQYMEGALWYLDGATRKWLNVEAQDSSKPARKLRPVN